MWGVALTAAALAGPGFDRIDAQQVGRTLIVDYVRTRGPVGADETVRLVVNSAQGRFAMPASAAPRRGRWTFPGLPRGVDAVEIRCPTGCRIRDLPVRAVTVPVRDGGEGPPPPPRATVLPVSRPAWAADPTVIDVCERVFVGDRDELRCLELARTYKVHPAAAVRACGQAFVGGTQELACVAAAAAAPLDPSGAISMCGRVFTSSRDELACVERVVGDPVARLPVVEACGRAFVSSSAELACIDLGLSRPVRAPEVIRACDRAFVGTAEQLECIRTSLPPR